MAGGVAHLVGVRPAWVRGAFALAVPLSLGLFAVVYGLLWALLPLEAPPSGQEAHG